MMPPVIWTHLEWCQLYDTGKKYTKVGQFLNGQKPLSRKKMIFDPLGHKKRDKFFSSGYKFWFWLWSKCYLCIFLWLSLWAWHFLMVLLLGFLKCLTCKSIEFLFCLHQVWTDLGQHGVQLDHFCEQKSGLKKAFWSWKGLGSFFWSSSSFKVTTSKVFQTFLSAQMFRRITHVFHLSNKIRLYFTLQFLIVQNIRSGTPNLAFLCTW